MPKWKSLGAVALAAAAAALPLPWKPRIMSLELLVETPDTVGVVPAAPVAVAGSAALASHGEAVLAPLTPKATMAPSSAVPEGVTVITAAVRGEDATAHQTSAS